MEPKKRWTARSPTRITHPPSAPASANARLSSSRSISRKRAGRAPGAPAPRASPTLGRRSALSESKFAPMQARGKKTAQTQSMTKLDEYRCARLARLSSVA
eukprot:4686429-Pyramimonas_sp.AAC.1